MSSVAVEQESRMTYQQAFAALDNGHKLNVTCPDGVIRKVWGYNPDTGDLFVAGWRGDVWMDCSNGILRATFEYNFNGA